MNSDLQGEPSWIRGSQATRKRLFFRTCQRMEELGYPEEHIGAATSTPGPLATFCFAARDWFHRSHYLYRNLCPSCWRSGSRTQSSDEAVLPVIHKNERTGIYWRAYWSPNVASAHLTPFFCLMTGFIDVHSFTPIFVCEDAVELMLDPKLFNLKHWSSVLYLRSSL
ncbi:hypothetical protein C8J56DRAFT_1048275 [Mycena floridula]|nr:hypothetical protein C8J56DRAFT_1048275 [Mycena floridula]